MNIKNIREQPYNELPDLPPPQEAIDTNKILKALARAERELGKLEGISEVIPNQNILFQAISMQEARASSEIENIYTTDDQLFGSPEKKDPEADKVKAYHKALTHGYDHLKSGGFLTTGLFIEICQIIRDTPEGLRHGHAYIANEIGGVKETVYTPPLGEDLIRTKLANLEKFINSDRGYEDDGEEEKIEALIKMAIMHYQFEAIHPFRDGNGRTGRILNVLFLVQAGLLKRPTLYLSRYITINKNAYYDALKNITERNDWETFIIYMLNCVEEMAVYTRRKADEIHGAMKEVQYEIEELRLKNPSLITELIFGTRYSTQASFVDAGVGTRKTVSDYLKQMEKAGILELVQQGKVKSYKNIKFMKILNS